VNIGKALIAVLKQTRPEPSAPKHQIQVYDVPSGIGDNSTGAVNIDTREVAIFRPPVMLDQNGHTVPGVSKDLIARYLVHTVAALADADLGPVTVAWKEQCGRFVNTSFAIQAWGQSVEIVHPIDPVSQDLANAWDMYKSGIARKVREMHKGHQKFGEANKLVRLAIRRLEQLRDNEFPQFSDAEYLFLQAAFQRAQVMSALIPVSGHSAEEVIGTYLTVE